MARSQYETTSLLAADYTESAGSVIFEPVTQKIALTFDPSRQTWQLPKGRRDIRESRAAAALRESEEETGVPGLEFASIDLLARCTVPSGCADIIAEDCGERVTRFRGLKGEPFMLQLRKLRERPENTDSVERIKLIWWYVTVCEIDVDAWDHQALHGEEGYQSQFHDVSAALDKLTFEDDKQVVREAMRLWHKTQIDKSSVQQSVS